MFKCPNVKAFYSILHCVMLPVVSDHIVDSLGIVNLLWFDYRQSRPPCFSRHSILQDNSPIPDCSHLAEGLKPSECNASLERLYNTN